MNKLAKADAATETARQSLAMNPDFTVEKAFNRLDKRALGNFSWVELQEYFEAHYQRISIEDAKLLERSVNQNCDGQIYFSHLRDYLLPQTDLELRTRLSARVSHCPLEYNTDRSLFHLLSAELKNSTAAVGVLQDLRLRHDYELYELYHLVDNSHCGFIDNANLGRFLRKNNVYLADADLEGILWRLGHHHTGRVTYVEFVHALTTVYGAYQWDPIHSPQALSGRVTRLERESASLSKVSPSSTMRDRQPETYTPYADQVETRPELKYEQDYLPESVVKSARKLEEARRELSDTIHQSNTRRNLSASFSSPVRLASSYASPLKYTSVSKPSFVQSSGQPHSNSNSRKLLYADERALADLLMEIIRLDNSVEEKRVNLATSEDFNLGDLWAHFNRFGKSHVDWTDIQQALDSWGLWRSHADIELSLRKATRGLNTLSYSQFCDLMLSKDRFYADRVLNRRPVRTLSSVSRSRVCELFKELIDNEVHLLASKDAVRSNITWHNQDAWNTLNHLDTSRISSEDFRVFLRDNHHYTTQAELDRLVDRFPTNAIYYSDFVYEIESRWR